MFAGMPVPVTVCPAPISKFAVAKVNVGKPFVVEPVAVNVPILDNDVPAISPPKTGVLDSLAISLRLRPGWAKSVWTPVPCASNSESNCQRFLSLGVKLDNVISITPVPTPRLLMSNLWTPLL